MHHSILSIPFKAEEDLFFAIYGLFPVPVAARSKAYVYGRSPAAIVGSNPVSFELSRKKVVFGLFNLQWKVKVDV